MAMAKEIFFLKPAIRLVLMMMFSHKNLLPHSIGDPSDLWNWLNEQLQLSLRHYIVKSEDA